MSEPKFTPRSASTVRTSGIGAYSQSRQEAALDRMLEDIRAMPDPPSTSDTYEQEPERWDGMG